MYYIISSIYIYIYIYTYTYILQPNKNNTWGCNYRVKNNCPLENKCLTATIVYKATVMNNANDESKFYYGVSETPFKERFRNHTK